jgi:hypothetical protein
MSLSTIQHHQDRQSDGMKVLHPVVKTRPDLIQELCESTHVTEQRSTRPHATGQALAKPNDGGSVGDCFIVGYGRTIQADHGLRAAVGAGC